MKQPLPAFKGLVFVYALLTVMIPFASSGQVLDYGKSYINMSKGVNGGTMEPGDTLQIRATFVVKSGTLDSCAFYDNIPAGTSYIPGSLAVITNEGKIYKAFTDAPGDDCGWISGSAITINLGYNTAAGKQATSSRRGQIKNTDKPSFFSSTCIMVASYKVKITAPYTGQIDLGGGSVTYKSGLGLINSIVFPSDKVAIFSNYGLCSNAVGANALGTEFNGTFGSGKNKDRTPSANVPPSYTYAKFSGNMPNDYYYGVSNNTSTGGAGYSTLNTWPKPDPSATSHRVFALWDIIGDHTGAVSPLAGNPAADTVNNSNAGYMLVINASYRIDSAFNQTITGLCPNTYYEFSLWMRNICSKCGCDSNGKGATNAGYLPTGAGDSSGVKPNLTLAVNGIDYYTTGDVTYSGQWIKKGFTYLTGPTQTSLTAMIRNNAPGGGGNDWAIDDISLATCTPNLVMNPSPNVTVCVGNQVDISSIVTSYFSNYTSYTWEKSLDNGATWTSTGISGTGTPVYSGGQWQYTATYPSFLATVALNNASFRIKVASTAGNLGNAGCSFTASTLIQVLTSTCVSLPAAPLLYVNGKTSDNAAQLYWAIGEGQPGLYFDIEKSPDGIHFDKIATLNADTTNGKTYSFTDPDALSATAYYRIRYVSNASYTYSRTVSFYTGSLPFEIKSLVNPFTNTLTFDAIAPADGPLRISIFDSFGRLVKQKQEYIYRGTNRISLPGMDGLAAGTYFLQAACNGQLINKSVMKLNQ